MNENNFVKQYGSFKAKINEVVYLLDSVIKNCKKKFFHTFKNRCVFDIIFTTITNDKSSFEY